MGGIFSLFMRDRHCDWVAIPLKHDSEGKRTKNKTWFCKTCRVQKTQELQPPCPVDALHDKEPA